ncbi:PIN domain-containing protein [Cytobacillus firmus]|uniref:PIN domain-containing protein n=1 Tax=Cytobacillus firmus TaxID=1399 RepID=UPI0030019725
MNIFIDTTVFHNGKDVFMNSLYNKILLNICKQNKFKIYISSVVLTEARRQYEIFINSHVKNVRTAVGAFNIMPNIRQINLNIPEVEDALKLFEKFYDELVSEGVVEIVKYNNDILPTLVERSINRIKPFTEKKQEFRDAIIWLSYVDFAESKNLSDCLLVTENTTDYCSKDKKLHPDLLNDSERFTLFINLHAVVESDFLRGYKENHDLLEHLRKKKWTNEDLLQLLGTPEVLSTIEVEVISYGNQDDITAIELDRAWVLSIEFITGDFIVRGIVATKIHGVGGQVDNEISVVFQATFNTVDGVFESISIEDIYDEYDSGGYIASTNDMHVWND